MEKKDGVDT